MGFRLDVCCEEVMGHIFVLFCCCLCVWFCWGVLFVCFVLCFFFSPPFVVVVVVLFVCLSDAGLEKCFASPRLTVLFPLCVKLQLSSYCF